MIFPFYALVLVKLGYDISLYAKVLVKNFTLKRCETKKEEENNHTLYFTDCILSN